MRFSLSVFVLGLGWCACTKHTTPTAPLEAPASQAAAPMAEAPADVEASLPPEAPIVKALYSFADEDPQWSGMIYHFRGKEIFNAMSKPLPTAEQLKAFFPDLDPSLGLMGAVLLYSRMGVSSFWEAISIPSSQDLFGIWGSSAEDLYIVGASGALLHSSGGSFSVQKSGTSADLFSVWGSSSKDVYVVGDKGTILHTSDGGATWQRQESRISSPLYQVWGTSPGDVYAVGGMGLILHTQDQGKSWKVLREDDVSLFGIWGSSAENLFVVGQRGLLLQSQDKGKSWTKINTGVSRDFLGILGEGKNIYIFGDDIHLLKTTNDGKNWLPDTVVNSSVQRLYAGYLSPGGELFPKGLSFLVGSSMSLFASNQNMPLWFDNAPSGAREDLRGIFGVGDDLFVVGSQRFARAMSKGRLSLRRGEYKEAILHFTDAMQKASGERALIAQAARGYAYLSTKESQDRNSGLSDLELVLNANDGRSSLDNALRAQLWFIVGQEEERDGSFFEAFQAYLSAQRLAPSKEAQEAIQRLTGSNPTICQALSSTDEPKEIIGQGYKDWLAAWRGLYNKSTGLNGGSTEERPAPKTNAEAKARFCERANCQDQGPWLVQVQEAPEEQEGEIHVYLVAPTPEKQLLVFEVEVYQPTMEFASSYVLLFDAYPLVHVNFATYDGEITQEDIFIDLAKKKAALRIKRPTYKLGDSSSSTLVEFKIEEGSITIQGSGCETKLPLAVKNFVAPAPPPGAPAPWTWSAYSFRSDRAQSDCAGGARYIGYNAKYGKWVGVELCSATRYKIFLGEEKAGEFHEIGDFAGHGQDHCELINPKFSLSNEDDIKSGCASCALKMGAWNRPGAVPVYWRYKFGQPFNLGTWPEYNLYTSVWYECGVSIP